MSIRSITSIVYEVTHRQPIGTEEVVDIHSIILPERFLDTKPKQWKMDRVHSYYKQHDCVDKPLSVVKKKNGKLILIDELTRYLELKNQHMAFVPVKYIMEQE